MQFLELNGSYFGEQGENLDFRVDVIKRGREFVSRPFFFPPGSRYIIKMFMDTEGNIRTPTASAVKS